MAAKYPSAGRAQTQSLLEKDDSANGSERMEVDIKVDSVVDAVERIKAAGGEVVYGPFDIRIGKCAVVRDPWGNRHVILDTTKGTYITDGSGNIIGQAKPE